ncbi:hypothetical protein BH11BAC7_BH11BAC7_22270 [soil metagenome]
MSKIFQFKITLQNSDPKIWRRFQVKDSISFYELHLVIQNVMGWTNSHLYQFIHNKNQFIGNPEMNDWAEMTDAGEINLSEIFTKAKMKMRYEYDFGDGWNHELTLEKIVEADKKQTYPFCLKGENNCPPEDCGGIWGFYEKLEILADKKHPDYEDMLDWIGDEYDPGFFDLVEINEALKDFEDIEIGLN